MAVRPASASKSMYQKKQKADRDNAFLEKIVICC